MSRAKRRLPRSTGLERWRDVLARFRGPGAYPYELAFLLLNPLRRLVLSPARLADRLALAPGARVLELGPGPGYFSPEVARRLPQGRLELCDLQPGMLTRARRRLLRAKARNFGLVCAEGTALPYRDASFDVVFLVAVLGEVPDPAACLREVARVLRPAGLVSITEVMGDPDALSLEQIRAHAGPAGLGLRAQRAGRGAFTADLARPTG